MVCVRSFTGCSIECCAWTERLLNNFQVMLKRQFAMTILAQQSIATLFRIVPTLPHCCALKIVVVNHLVYIFKVCLPVRVKYRPPPPPPQACAVAQIMHCRWSPVHNLCSCHSVTRKSRKSIFLERNLVPERTGNT